MPPASLPELPLFDVELDHEWLDAPRADAGETRPDEREVPAGAVLRITIASLAKLAAGTDPLPPRSYCARWK